MDKYTVAEEKRNLLSKIIKKKRKEKKLGLNQLALKTGVQKSLISRLENALILKINPKLIKLIAEGLDLDYMQLYKVVGYVNEEDYSCKNKKGTIRSEVKFLDAKIVELPVYGKASAGKGYINLENIIKYKRVIANGFSADSFLVEVSGDSMATIINDEDIVVVDPQLKDYEPGKVYVVTLDDETYIKQVQCPKKNMIVLKSFNSKYDDKYIIDEEIKDLKIEGRVVKIISERRI